MTLLLAAVQGLLAAVQPADSDLVPLRPGSSWEFLMSNGAAATARIDKTSTVGGTVCAVVETTVNGQASREHLAVTPEGLKAFKMENAFGAMDLDPPALRVKLPFRPGEEWTAQVREGGGIRTYRYRSEGFERIRVPQGEVEAARVSTTLHAPQGAMTSNAWYARGIGLVRQSMEFNGRNLVSELVKADLPAEAPAAATGVPGVPPPFAPPPATAASNVDVVRFESKDGKALLYPPRGWKVTEAGEGFGPGTWALSVEEPDESAGVLFMTFTLNEGLKDSVALSTHLLGNLSRAYPTLKVGRMASSKERARTTAEAAYHDGAKDVAARFHFFHTGRVGTMYALMARKDKWESSRAILAQITANLAYAPEGVLNVLDLGRTVPAAAPRPQGRSLNPAWVVKDAQDRANRGEGADVPMQPATAQDGSFQIEVPRGWHFQGASLGYTVTNDAKTNGSGASSVMATVFVPGYVAAPTAQTLVSAYLPPVQALEFLLQKSGLGRSLRVLGATTLLEVDPQYLEKVHKSTVAAGGQVDNRLLLVEFANAVTGAPSRGVFSVTSTAWPLGTAWTLSVDGSWAPSEEFDRLLPVFSRITGSSRQNEAWVQGKFSAQAAESKRLQGNLMKSIGELHQSYDRYNQSWWDSQKSRDYTSWAWSQTTLGQGSWVSQLEGAEVVRSDSWGVEDLQAGRRTSAWNTTTFTGRNPWTNENLDLVDTRAEYEKHVRGR